MLLSSADSFVAVVAFVTCVAVVTVVTFISVVTVITVVTFITVVTVEALVAFVDLLLLSLSSLLSLCCCCHFHCCCHCRRFYHFCCCCHFRPCCRCCHRCTLNVKTRPRPGIKMSFLLSFRYFVGSSDCLLSTILSFVNAGYIKLKPDEKVVLSADLVAVFPIKKNPKIQRTRFQ